MALSVSSPMISAFIFLAISLIEMGSLKVIFS
jgi:hypothetical protein